MRTTTTPSPGIRPGSFTLTDETPRVPTMIQVAEYTPRGAGAAGRGTGLRAGSKFTFFDTIGAAGIDVMQIAPRASTHLDWTRFALANPFGPFFDHGVYGEMVTAYYTLAWLDRYVAAGNDAGSHQTGRGTEALAKWSLRRLSATGTERSDRSVDTHSIGAGFFDADTPEARDDPEAGDVPVNIANPESAVVPGRQPAP